MGDFEWNAHLPIYNVIVKSMILRQGTVGIPSIYVAFQPDEILIKKEQKQGVYALVRLITVKYRYATKP